MRWFPAVALVVACSSEPAKTPDAAPGDSATVDTAPLDAAPDAPDAFDTELAGFGVALCTAIFTCSDPDGTQADCEADVREDMLALKAMLDDARELDCATCMRVTAEQANVYVASGCDASARDDAAIEAACDLTPNNGNVDTDEACGGSP